MTYRKYRVPRDEKIEIVARQFGINIDELRKLNPQMKTFKNFWGTETYIPFNEVIIVPEIKEKLEKNFLMENVDFDFEKYNKNKIEIEKNAQNLLFNWDESDKYKIEISTSLHILEKPLGKNITESIWQISYGASENSISIQLLEKKNIKIDGQLKPLIEIVDKINKTTENLKIKLNDKKSFEKVLELDTILKKWEYIKFNDLKYYELEDEYFKNIIRAYDAEFKILSKSISSNILYQLFFYPRGLVKYPITDRKIIAENTETISQLFPRQYIQYDLWYKSKIENEKIIVDCTSTEPEKWNKNVLKGEYEKNYGRLISDEFNFKFRLESCYIYTADGVLESGKAYIQEQASKGLFYISEYTFTRIEEQNINV